jgi:NAD(P)-dependent dehydrogenase (short-subunit alcohol dehydrogenase family)
VEVTDGTAEYNASRYRLSVFYDLAKIAVNRLAFCLGHELEPHGATAVAITPGWLRSEMSLDNFGGALLHQLGDTVENSFGGGLGTRQGQASSALVLPSRHPPLPIPHASRRSQPHFCVKRCVWPRLTLYVQL